ncbi:MAG: type II toxin-antitoxin system prevent-host-death family antitoxin [Chloroflexi bacterium]|nr:MAG: type II toxin-antitoxin system prevent-host-death family antitoxin [Chloroflexota bacterium]
MNEIGAYEAKTHFSALLQRVRQGEKFYITHHGVRLAALTPVEGAASVPVQDVIDSLKAFRRGRRLDTPIRDLLNEGRA